MGPYVIPSNTAGDGYTRKALRRSILEKLGPFGVYLTDGQASGREARRQVVCSSLIDDAEDVERLKDRYLRVCTGDDADRQTRVLDTGYQGPVGYVGVSRPMTAPLASGIEFELSWPLPSGPYLDMLSGDRIVNMALEQCWIIDRLPFTSNGSYQYLLTDYEWLTSDDQVIGPVDTIGVPTNGNPMTAATSWRIRSNGSVRYLETDLAYSSGDAFQLQVYRPANTLIRRNGVWGAGDGLTSDDDAAAVPVYIVKAIGLTMAFEHLKNRAPYDPKLAPSVDHFQREYERWGRAATRLKWEDAPRDATPRPLVSGGARAYVGDKGLWSSW